MSPPATNQISPMRWIIVIVFGIMSWVMISKQLTDSSAIPPGEKFLKEGNLPKAQFEFEKTIKADPASPQNYLSVAGSCQRVGKADLALGYLERALHACKDAPLPARAELYSTQAGIFQIFEKKPQNQSLLASQRAMQLDPSNAQYLNSYGYLLADNLPEGDPRLAESAKILTRALVLIRTEKNFWIRLLNPVPELMKETAAPAFEDSYGWVLYKQNQPERAISALQQAIQDHDDLVVAGKVSGDKKEIAALLKVLYYHLGASYQKANKKEEARRAYQTSLGFDKDFPEAKEALAQLAGDKP